MKIAILLYDAFTALDCVGPYEVLSRLPGADLSFVAKAAGPVRADTGFLTLVADRALAELPDPDLLLVPGGPGSRVASRDGEILAWVRRAHRGARWTTSVCTGSEVLAAAGVLEGKQATTHWLFRDRLREHGVEPVAQRVVFGDGVATAAGVSSGIDMALALAAREVGASFAQALQLGIEYDPQPPFRAGSPQTAPPEVVALVRAAMRPEAAEGDLPPSEA